MKYLIVSDIHGHLEYIKYLEYLIEQEQPTKIILLGDIFSLGDNQEVLDIIDKYKDNIIIIKGNCDHINGVELRDFYKEVINGSVFVFTHGHLINYLPYDDFDVLVQGHTHANRITNITHNNKNVILYNPGSIALPRNNTVNSYGLITDDELIVKDLEGSIIKSLTYKK